MNSLLDHEALSTKFETLTSVVELWSWWGREQERLFAFDLVGS